MSRKYELKQRAEKQQETRRRIVEAVVDLHEQIGLTQTTISAIAEKAGVQRLTVYRHFPDERALFHACMTHWMNENPLPDPEPWLDTADPCERLRRGLSELYAYYQRVEPMLTNVERDAPLLPVVAEIQEPMVEAFRRIYQVLIDGFGAAADRQPLLAAALSHALAFGTWRSLAREQGLDNDQVTRLMLILVDGVVAGGNPSQGSPPVGS